MSFDDFAKQAFRWTKTPKTLYVAIPEDTPEGEEHAAALAVVEQLAASAREKEKQRNVPGTQTDR